ncbi:diguanylate cyclase (GGDEF)-like protein [Silvimonas terrae]|uniref:Diguanylate cyclase (GGDEF)-like protein n=1 Tax=Silvimonas terrae TaxID=300266 RepID=A0A840RHJ6_9NEIS|nr:GGDEF domain-containing protein [Silvimonas terrae]MBB5191743.1 diguanylate cyclase (GGDEF)-like protein [Silvimonas terrae]
MGDISRLPGSERSRVMNRAPSYTGRARLRLRELRHQIELAETTLDLLQAEINESEAWRDLTSVRGVLQENQRLLAQIGEAARDADAVQLVLAAAIKASESDPLTGLPNRSVLWRHLTRDIAIAKRHRSHLAVYFLDLDGFKTINDQLGHAIGDLLLQGVAVRLRDAVREVDTVCRLGGDEFVVVASEIKPENVTRMANKLSRLMAGSHELAGRNVVAMASIGCSVFPEDGDTPELLVCKADQAMYRAKHAKLAR